MQCCVGEEGSTKLVRTAQEEQQHWSTAWAAAIVVILKSGLVVPTKCAFMLHSAPGFAVALQLLSRIQQLGCTALGALGCSSFRLVKLQQYTSLFFL